MFGDMIDTLLGAQGNLLLLVGATQYRVSIERCAKDGFKSSQPVCDQEIHKFSYFDSKRD